jgi:hypothetical protein
MRNQSLLEPKNRCQPPRTFGQEDVLIPSGVGYDFLESVDQYIIIVFEGNGNKIILPKGAGRPLQKANRFCIYISIGIIKT